MPANLTPDYQRADRRYREAKTPAEKLAALEEMLRTIPKHKGTEKLQADLKRKIKHAREARQAKKAAGAKDPFHVDRQGAGQVVLCGLPNAGKSLIVEVLTQAPVKVAEFPFSTHAPVPGMAYHEDVPIQLVDMPPVIADHVPPGYIGAVRNADIVLVVLDAAVGSMLEDLERLTAILGERRVALVRELPDANAIESDAPLAVRGLIACTKCDLPGALDNVQAMRELIGGERPLDIVTVSGASGENLDSLLRTLFSTLRVLRVYAKPPGKPVDHSRPFILPIGCTVIDVARVIHKEIAEHLKYARIWGDGVFAGQQVHHDHELHDKDVVELHI